MEDQVQGIKLEEGGIASSVNMATLVYKNWKQEGDQFKYGISSDAISE